MASSRNRSSRIIFGWIWNPLKHAKHHSIKTDTKIICQLIRSRQRWLLYDAAIDGLLDWLADDVSFVRYADRLIDWLIGWWCFVCSLHWLIDWLIDWLIGWWCFVCSLHWLIDWLIGYSGFERNLVPSPFAGWLLKNLRFIAWIKVPRFLFPQRKWFKVQSIPEIKSRLRLPLDRQLHVRPHGIRRGRRDQQPAHDDGTLLAGLWMIRQLLTQTPHQHPKHHPLFGPRQRLHRRLIANHHPFLLRFAPYPSAVAQDLSGKLRGIVVETGIAQAGNGVGMLSRLSFAVHDGHVVDCNEESIQTGSDCNAVLAGFN